MTLLASYAYAGEKGEEIDNEESEALRKEGDIGLVKQDRKEGSDSSDSEDD